MAASGSDWGRFAAVDIGGSSGRVVIASVRSDAVVIERLERFENIPEWRADGLHSNLTAITRKTFAALQQPPSSPICSVGFDTWSGDYGLLRKGRLIDEPFNQRDQRAIAVRETTRSALTRERIFAVSGVRDLPYLALHQLAADARLGRLAEADTLLLLPDLMAFTFCGVAVAEYSNASTTGLTDWRKRQWDDLILQDAGIPRSLLPPLVGAGEILGPLLPEAADLAGVDRRTVVTTVASHDTASAIVALPVDNHDFAYVSCGTWSLVGVELTEPIISDRARELEFTNEAGIDGTVRFLHISAGLWLLAECFRVWKIRSDDSAASHLLEMAEQLRTPEYLIDTTDERYFATGNMPQRIIDDITTQGGPVPSSREAIVRVILESLAQTYARQVDRAAQLSGIAVREIYLVGGGSRNGLLCQLTADYSGLTVFAGPVEATSIGNLLVQARTHGILHGGLESLRRTARRSFAPTLFLPRA
jgi:rhamnulokinase